MPTLHLKGLTPPPGGHLISVAEAAEMTAAFRATHSLEVRAWLLDRGAIDTILAQPDCAGIRIYRAHNAEGAAQVVVVGTDENGTDLLPADKQAPGLVAERTWPCPPICGGPSVLGP